jgi:DNA-binding XRE family transcriptional regulator
MSTTTNLLAMRFELGRQRNLQGLSFDALAQLSGVGRRTLISIESGESRGSIPVWMDICEALQCKFSTFIAMTEED